MTKAEERQIEEIERVKKALNKTTSPMLKRDYTKYLNRLQKELKEYRKLREESA